MVQLGLRDGEFVMATEADAADQIACVSCQTELTLIKGHERMNTTVNPHFRHTDTTHCTLAVDGEQTEDPEDSWATIRTAWLSKPTDGRQRYLRYAKAPSGAHCLLLHNTMDDAPSETVCVRTPDTRALERVFWLFERASANDETDGWQTIGTIGLSSPDQANAAWLTLKSPPSERFTFQLTKWSGLNDVENVFGGFFWTESRIEHLKTFFHDIIELDSE